MTTATDTPPPTEKRYTEADLLALPDDGIRRWLINGKIVEMGMTVRNRHHTRIEARIAHLLESWRNTLPRPRGSVHSGEAGVRLNDELTVGIDVVYLSPEVAARQTDENTTLLVGIPTLAVEILSPSDTQEWVTQRRRTYRSVGVPVVWVIDPDMRTVAILRPNKPLIVRTEEQELDGGDELPGFRVPVARIFEE
jgi:Uma2 family endonuclease